MDDALSNGNDALKYTHYTSISKYILVPTAAMFILGVLSIVTGLWYFHDELNIDQDTYNFIRMACSVLALAFAAIAMKVRLLTESIHIMLMSLSVMIFSVSELSFGEPGFSWTNIFFMIGFVTCGAIYAMRREYLMSAATLIMSLSLFLESLGFGKMLFSIGMLTAGVIYFIIGSRTAISDARKEKVFVYIGGKTKYNDKEYAHVLVSTVGILSFSMLSLVLGYYALGAGHSYSLYVTKMVISAITLMFGTYALSKGVVAEGLMMFLLSLSAFIFSALHLFHVEGPLLLDMILSLFFIPLAYRFALERNYLMSITSVLIALMLFLESFTSMASVLEVAIMCIKIISAVMAITAWIYYETGKELMPKFFNHRLSDEEVSREIEEEDKNQNITITSFLVVSLLILWAGVTYINTDLVITPTDLMTYQYTKVVISAFVLVFTLDTFKRGLVTEGIMNMIITISSLTFSICYLTFGYSGPTSLDLLFSIGMYVSAFIFLRRKDYALGLAAIVFGIAMSYPFFYNVDTSLPMGVGFVIAGVVLAGYAFKGLISPKSGSLLHICDRSDCKYSKSDMLVIAGLFILGITALMNSYSTEFITYFVAEVFLSGVVAIFSIYALVKNSISEGLMMLLFVIPTITYAITMIFNAEPSDAVDILFALAGIVLIPLFAMKKNYLLSASMFGFNIIWPIGLLLGNETLASVGMIVCAATVLVYTIWKWVDYEKVPKVTPA